MINENHFDTIIIIPIRNITRPLTILRAQAPLFANSLKKSGKVAKSRILPLKIVRNVKKL